MTPDEEYAYSRGFDAWLDGLDMDEYPYDAGSGEAEAWIAGWKVARDSNT